MNTQSDPTGPSLPTIKQLFATREIAVPFPSVRKRFCEVAPLWEKFATSRPQNQKGRATTLNSLQLNGIATTTSFSYAERTTR